MKKHGVAIVSSLLMSWTALAEGGFPEVDQARPSLYGSTRGVTCPVKVVPGKSIGQVQLGASMDELRKSGLEIKKVRGAGELYVVGPYSVRLEGGKVQRLEAELGDLPDCIVYGQKKLAKTADLSALKRIFSACRDEEPGEGGNLTLCEGLGISTGGWGGQQKTPALRLPQ